MFSTIDTGCSLEATKQILDISSYKLRKLIRLNLIDTVPISGTRKYRYHGQSVANLAFARRHPFLIPNGEKALVCSIGVESGPSVPSMYIDATWARYEQAMQQIHDLVSDDEWQEICDGTIRVTGNWGVSAKDCEELISNNSLVVASYAGFILDGARMVREIEGYTPVQGKRAFLVRPLDSSERLTYARTYLLSKQGPVNKVWTSEELKEAAKEQVLTNKKNSMNLQREYSELENNSLGGAPIFRGIDQSEAFLVPYYSTGKSYASLQSLESWFSAPRMRRYAAANRPDFLYIWDTKLSKAFLEDICHVEVLLRNFIHNRLTKDSRQADWYHNTERYDFNELFKDSVVEAEDNLKKNGRAATPDQVIASLSLGNWHFLLTKNTIWKALINPDNGGMPHYPGRNRTAFERDVKLIHQLRNRASHQEPLIMEAALTDDETEQLDRYAAAILNTAKRLDPEAADWIIAHSRVDSIRKQRPN